MQPRVWEHPRLKARLLQTSTVVSAGGHIGFSRTSKRPLPAIVIYRRDKIKDENGRIFMLKASCNFRTSQDKDIRAVRASSRETTPVRPIQRSLNDRHHCE